jgi:magnesium chelatase family protein
LAWANDMGMAAVWSFALAGMDAVPVTVEAHSRNGLPGVTIVGLPGPAVREARERVRSGAAGSGVPLPTRRITVNLSPVDLPKQGSGFDLPVALAVLAASGLVDPDCLRSIAAIGELALDGAVRPVRGILAVAEAARKHGLSLLLVPAFCLPEASAAGGMVAGVRSLLEALLVLGDARRRERVLERGRRWLRRRVPTPRETAAHIDLADVMGHEHAKRALEVAAAGGHHVLMVGPPGSGKTMLARRLPTILPPLSRDESIEVTRVWSVAGAKHVSGGLMTERPFRAPHHTASRAALVGGGTLLHPGEVSLAHRGVLFLDELPEFSRDALEALRQPLEEGCVAISRRAGTCLFPAALTLIGAMNPCHCGFFGHPEKACRCPPAAIVRYRARISGPLLDRIDILLEIPPLRLSDLEARGSPETSEVIRVRVAAAKAFRAAREARAAVPGSSPPEARMCLDAQAVGLLRQALIRDAFGGRGYLRIIHVARTLADLDQAHTVNADHVAEALSLRLDHRRIRFG